ncbi:hypothetical protein [Dyadobacter sp. NIV53]|uniref:hypothetical protein n=1 Tax=Dyadobacter sp. NIV53 TaxID=2861765 RepID=UPI001C88DFB9|nr:hypothetical protein [Dyadobacter sp. NIV53]
MRTLCTVLLLLVSWLLWLVLSQYFFCARFQFQDPAAFEGDILFNPYESIKPESWVKCNFHAHAKAWNGITNGHGDAADIHQAYQSLSYGIHCVSNYHHIDSTNADNVGFISAYEHGYNISKTHQLVLGSNKVQWLDYILPQTIHNKQHILKNLYHPDGVVILNHPELRNGYTKQDFENLSNYDCMEVLNPSVISTNQWDAALSAGKKVFIVGNDDIHNVIAKDRLGKMCTFVNVPAPTGRNVLQALKSGQSYGVVIGNKQNPDSIPHLNCLQVNKTSVSVEMDQPASEVTVTGQNGKVIANYKQTNKIDFQLKSTDHYARATFRYENGTMVFLNPVFFTSGSGYQQTTVYENRNETMLFRTMGIIVLCGWLLFLWQLNMNSGQRSGRHKFSLR